MMAARRPAGSIALPIGVSALLHVALFASVFVLRAAAPKNLPPMYKVDIVAAPPGPRAAGVVTDAPPPATPEKAPPRPESKVPEKVVPLKRIKGKVEKTPPKATPNITEKSTPAKATPAPKAGGGAIGGKGNDVATVRTDGIDFPYPGYLNNIVRQIALNFSPRGNLGALKAEVFFMIRRDGTVAGFRFLTRSGNMAFDLEAQGAVEAATRAFGALPTAFSNDVLPVVFSFDPSKMR
jgi:protein TonB